MNTQQITDIAGLYNHSAPANIQAEIRAAATATGVDFSYLMQEAHMESSFRPELEASTSSATGLYQFLEQTWLETVKNHGAEHGYEDFTEAIKQDENGRLHVENDETRQKILDLRKDPRAAARMAGEFAADNIERLEETLGRSPDNVEIYMAHFMGAGGASRFLLAQRDDPTGIAAIKFPTAAAANRNVFFKASGAEKTYQEIYDSFATRMGESPAPQPQTQPIETITNTIIPITDFSTTALPQHNIPNNEHAHHNILPQSYRVSSRAIAPPLRGVILSVPVMLALADLALPLENNNKDDLYSK